MCCARFGLFLLFLVWFSLQIRTLKDMRKVGVFVDVNFLNNSGGFGMNYDVLRNFAIRDSGMLSNLFAYMNYNQFRAEEEEAYHRRQRDFEDRLRDFGFTVTSLLYNEVFSHTEGNSFLQSTSEVRMAMDILVASEYLDTVVIVSGSDVFYSLFSILRNKGCRVEVIGFKNVSEAVRCGSDFFLSGYLIPNLLSPQDSDGVREDFRRKWGEPGFRTRGICYSFNQEKKFGFIRFLRSLDKLWIVDARNPESPWETSFIHLTELPSSVSFEDLPSRDKIFEFTLSESEKGFQSKEVVQINEYR